MTIRTTDITAALSAAKLLVDTRGTLPPEVASVEDDSRNVRAGSLFIAVKGSERDGHDFLEGAHVAGATVAIVEDPKRASLPSIVVRDGRKAAAIAASVAFAWPVRELSVAAVTGT